jgi:hypothetical protein
MTKCISYYKIIGWVICSAVLLPRAVLEFIDRITIFASVFLDYISVFGSAETLFTSEGATARPTAAATIVARISAFITIIPK